MKHLAVIKYWYKKSCCKIPGRLESTTCTSLPQQCSTLVLVLSISCYQLEGEYFLQIVSTALSTTARQQIRERVHLSVIQVLPLYVKEVSRVESRGREPWLLAVIIACSSYKYQVPGTRDYLLNPQRPSKYPNSYRNLNKSGKRRRTIKMKVIFDIFTKFPIGMDTS